jgi:hypothetical protein
MINLLPKLKLESKLLRSCNLLQKPLQTTFPLFLTHPLLFMLRTILTAQVRIFWIFYIYISDSDVQRVEAAFIRKSVFNSHNSHLWAQHNPMWDHQVRWSITERAGIIGHCVVGPYLIPDRLNGPAYCDFLQDALPALLEDVLLAVWSEVWFQHDGAPAHFSAQTQQHFDTQFPDRWLGCGALHHGLRDRQTWTLWTSSFRDTWKKLFTGIRRLTWRTWQQSFMLLWRPLMQICYDVCKLVFQDVRLHVSERMVDTLNAYCNYHPQSYTSVMFCVGKRCVSWHVWTVHPSYVHNSFVLTYLFMSVTCCFFEVIQPSVCLPLSLSVITNFFATYNRCDSCPIWRFLLTMISWVRFILENSSFYIFVLFWGILPVSVVIMRHYFQTLCNIRVWLPEYSIDYSPHRGMHNFVPFCRTS